MFKKAVSISLCLLLGISVLGMWVAPPWTNPPMRARGSARPPARWRGALLDSNGWRGGVIGGALGALAGGAITYIAGHASRQAAQSNQPVVYQKNDGREKVTATPVRSTSNNCKIVKERYYKDGQMYKEVEREVCN